MRGQKEKDKAKYVDSMQPYIYTQIKKDSKFQKDQILTFTKLDLIPIVFNKENVFKWLAESGWIEGMCFKRLGENFPYYDDYVQDIYLQIYDKLDHLIDIYESTGITAFCGYIKTMVNTNCLVKTCKAYKNHRAFHDHIVTFDDTVWNDIIDKYDADSNQIYKFNKNTDIDY